MKHKKLHAGFTIVELLVVIVVIAIIGALVVIAFIGFQARAKDTVLKGEINGAKKALAMDKSESDEYPQTLSQSRYGSKLLTDSKVAYQYTTNGSGNSQSYCLTSSYKGVSKHYNSATDMLNDGACAGHVDASLELPDTEVASVQKGSFDTPAGTPVNISISYNLQPNDLVLVLFSNDFYTNVASLQAGSTSFSQFYNKTLGSSGYQQILGMRASGMTGPQTLSLTTVWRNSPGYVQGTDGEYLVYVIKDKGSSSITATDTSYGGQTRSSTIAPAAQTIAKGQLAIFSYLYYGNTLPSFNDASIPAVNWTVDSAKTSAGGTPRVSARHIVAQTSGTVGFSMTMPGSGVVCAGAALFVFS